MSSVLVTESIALRAASELKREDGGRLRERFPSFFDGHPDAYQKAVSGMAEAERILAGIPGTRVREMGEGGLFRALWICAEEAECGLEIDASAIPVLQETVELCEFCGISPYEADSCGALLAFCPDAFEAAWYLRRAGIPACPVGIVTNNKRRVIHFGERERFLDRP